MIIIMVVIMIITCENRIILKWPIFTLPHVAGLFTADQNLKGTLPIYTRQNAAGTRRGFEVPEERDYFPYWGPTPWKDIAIMVSDRKTEHLMKEYVNSPHYGHKCEYILNKCRWFSILAENVYMQGYMQQFEDPQNRWVGRKTKRGE